MNRRHLVKTLLAMPAAAAQEAARRTAGLPRLTIKDVKVIKTTGGARYRWVFLKIITSEPGLYGIGSANNAFQTDGDRGAGEPFEAVADGQGSGSD